MCGVCVVCVGDTCVWVVLVCGWYLCACVVCGWCVCVVLVCGVICLCAVCACLQLILFTPCYDVSVLYSFFFAEFIKMVISA